MTNTPITIAIAGPGDANYANVADLLNDWLGFGEPDDEGYFEPSEREVTLILPITSEQLEGEGFRNVLDWSEKADLPFVAVTDDSKGRKITRLLDEATETHKVAAVEQKIVSLLKDADGEAVLVALWGEDGDEFTERLLSLADENGVKAKDLTAGLDDLSFADEGAADEPPAAEPEPEPDPEPEEAPRGRGRRRRGAAAPAEEEATEDEVPLEEAAPEPEPEPEPVVEEAPKRTRRSRTAAPVEEETPAEEPTPQDKAETSIRTNAKEAAETLRKQEASNVEPTVNPWSKPYPPADLANRFAFHAATTEEKRNAHTSVRAHCQMLAEFIDEALPDGREKSMAITKIEEAMFWANASLARQNTAQQESVAVAEAAEEEPKRGRGRPRKDGTPAQPRTEDDLKVAFLEDEEGNLRRRGRGRPRKGETVVELTPAEVKEAEAEGRIAQ